MSSSSNVEILAKSLKIEGKNSSSGIWLHYNQEIQGLEYNHINKDLSYVGELQNTPITPDIIFVGQNYPSLTFAMDFLPGSNTTVTSERKGLLPLTISKNNLNVSYTPMETTDMFTFSLYSGDNSSERTILKEITIDTIDVIPTYIEGNPTINTLNNLYTGLTMNFFENVDSGTVTTFSSESSVSNVIFSNGKCSFDYRTPTTHTSDKIIFSNLRNERIQVINKAPQNFELTNLKLQPAFSSWLLTPASQNFSYINSDSLTAIFTKDIQTCTSITASSGLPSTIIPDSIIGNQVNFEWSSLNTGNVTFTFNGLTAVDGSIDANLDGLTTVGPVILNTPATIIGWTGVQPNEPNTLYNVSVTFNKQLSASRTPVITSSDTSNPVFTSISGSTINFTLTTSSNPDYTVYTFSNVKALDSSIKNGATISAGAKIVSVQVETDITSSGSYVTMSKLVKLRAQKVKIFLSKPIVGTLSLVTNSNCTFGAVTMITSSIAEFRITPLDNGLSLTIESDNIICQEDNSQSTISHTFDLVYSQTVLNLFETSNKNSSKTTFDVGTDVALSLEVSKEILDLSSTTITSSNCIISNVTFTSELGRYYYNFNLLPTLSGTNETIYINKAKDLNGFKYDIFKSSLNFANVFPKTISYFGNGFTSGEIESSFSLRKDVFKTVTITLSGVTSQTPTAYVYYSYTSDSLSPTLLGTYSFSRTGGISFPFTPTVLGTVYFYIKGITIMGIIQPDFLVSPGVSVLWFAPSSASLVCSLNGATSGDDYNVMGLASGKIYSDVLISLQWADNISNPLNIAETGAVQLYIGGTVVPNGITSYTYNSITNNILIGSINPGSRVGNMYISITLTSPAGTTIDIETVGHTVYAVPDTVSIATISDGYSLINSKEIQTKFFFSHTNNSINSLMTILDTGFTANIVNVTSTATIELDTSITIPRNIGAKVTSTNNQQTFTFMFLSTRTTVQVIVPLSNIYTFPESSTFTITSDGISKGSVVTLNKISSLVWTFPNSLPSSVIHTITATGATISSSIASPLTSSRLSLVYKLTPTIKQNIVPTVSITFGGITVTYTETVLLAENIYKLPSGLSALVSFVGSSTSGLDSFISTLAIGASYGSDAGNALCGPGNTSSILLTLTDFDSVTENTNEITKVTCVNSSTLVAVGTDPTYTYTSSTHSASIKLYTVPTDLTSSVKFSVIVTAPDGYTTTLNSIQTFLTELGATTASLGSVATGITFVSGSNVNVPVTFSNAVGVLTPSTLISTNGTFSAISTSVTSGSFSATYTGEAISTDITFTVAPTQRRIIVSVPASAILVWPTSASTAPVNSVTIGIASAMKTTLSSSVQSSVTASFGSLTASDSSTGSSLSTPSVSGAFVTYTITTTSEATYTSSVTLSVSTYSKTYNQTIVNADQIYAWPTGVEAVLSLNGATSGSDYNILGFAAGRTYTSSVTLSLKGIDPSPVNTSEVAASGAIRVYVSGTLVSNVVTSYTYISNTHEVIVNSMTLGVQTGALQFGVTVTAPSGSTYELLSSGHTVYAVPDTVTIGTIGSGYSLIASNPIATTFTFSHTNNTLNNSLGTLATGASSSILSLVSTATVTLSSTFGTSKVLNATITSSASQQTFTFMFASTRTTAVSTVLSSAIYSFPTSVTFSQPPFSIGSSTIVTATTNTTLPSGMSWVITASLGTIGSGSGTTLYSSAQLSFTYTAVSKSEVTGTLTLTWASLSCTLTSTLATVIGTYNSPTTLTYDGASLNPTFYSRHFKHGTAGSVKLIVDGELILGDPQAITNAVSSVTYSQTQTAALSSIYATNTSGTTKTGGYNPDAFSSTLLVAFPGDSLSDVSHLINTSTTAKTLTTKSGSSVTTTTSKFYGSSVSTFTNALTGAIRFGDFATNITTNNFTVEMWVNVFNTSRAYTPLFCTRPLTTNTLVLGIAWSGAQPNGYSPGALHLRTWANTSYVGSSYNVTSNAWHHIAMTKSGTTYKVYLNGTLGLTSTITESIPGGTQFILGGFRAPAFGDGSDDADDAQAYFNDLRFYTSVKYTANFSVDSTPITTTTTASLAGATFTSSSFTVQMTPTVYSPMTITTVLNMPSAGTKTLTCSVPLSDFYTYIYPTTITSISPTTEIYTGDSTLMTFNLSPVDGAPNATAIIYQASTSSSITPTQVSNGTATGAGVLTASCTFPTVGTWYLYALISSPSGTAATTRIVCSTPITVSTYVMPTTMTYDGSSINQGTFGTGFGFKQNVSSDVILSFARLYRGNPPNISNAYSSVTYTQPSSAVFPPIYITSSTGAKIGGVNSDPFASWLVLAIPGNALLDVSNSINSSSTTKGVYAFGSGVVTSITQSKFYGSSIYIPGWVASANTGIKVTGMPTGFLYGDWTAEGWFYLTTLNTATLFKLGVCTNPSSVSNTTTNPTIRLLIESATTSWVEITAGTYYQASFSSSVFAINQWFHVALVRSASPGNKGIFTVFVNGTARTLTQNLATGTRPVGDPGTIMFVGTHDDTNTNSCNINGYVQDVRFYVTSKYTSNFSVSSLSISKTATLVSSTSTSLRLAITPDYYDTITFSASLKGPSSTTGIATTTTSITDIVPAPAEVHSSTISARYLRLTLFYAGGTGTSGPSFPKLGIYTQSADAYEDTGISSLNIARSATFISVSGDSAAATTTSMLSCINDTRTSWSASTSGTTFGTTKTTGPAYYTIDIGSIQTIAALKFAEVTYESTGWQWFSAKIEFSTDNVSWNLAHLVNATGNETQPYLHSGYSLNTSLIGESLVLAVVSRQYKPTSYLFPASLGAVTGTLSEGISGKLSIVVSTTQGATAIVAHSSAAPDANGVFTLFSIPINTITSGIVLSLDAGNVASYPGTGVIWSDLSENGNTGTLTNGPIYNSSNSGYITFDGTDDHVLGNISTSFFTGAHTISCWFYNRSVVGWASPFSNNTTNNGCSILTFSGTGTFLGANQAGINTTTIGVELGSDHINRWIYATIVYSGVTSGSVVTVYAYKNDTLLTGGGTLYWNLSTSSSYYIGRHYSGGHYINGHIANVSVYNRALTASEIEQNYNSLKGRFGFGTASNPVIGTGTFDSGTLTTIVKPILSGQVYFYVKPTAPGGGLTSSSYLVVGPVTVAPYQLPTSISLASISVLSVSTSTSGQTLTLSGPNVANLLITNIVVFLNTSSTVVSNCTVTGYNSATGVVTFTATPTISGMNTIYTKVTSPSGTTTTTLSFLGTTGQGVYVDSAPIPLITSSAGAIATRTINGSTYTCIRMSGTLTIPSAITGAEILMIAGGGGGGFTGVGGGGAGGAAHISRVSIPAGNYAVTVGAGGAGGTYDGAQGTSGSNTVAFGVTVYGGGGGGHAGNALAGGCGGGAGYGTGSGGTVTASTGSLSGITGTLVTYGNAGGANSVAVVSPFWPGAGGGGIGGVGGLATASPMRSGAGGVGRSTWSDWCAACGIGEGDTSGVFWIGGGGGAALNEVSNVRAAGAGGKGGGGRGGWAYIITSNGIDGIGTSGLDYSGGGGGSGHIVLSGTGGTSDLGNGPAGAGGSGVIIIKQEVAGGYSTITSPMSVAGLQVWLDGSDPNNGTVPADGATIATWVDKVTGNLHSAVPVNTAKRAIFKGAGTVGGIKTTLGTMFFNNTPYRIPYTSFSPTYTIFSVFRAESGLTTAGLSMMPVLTNNSCYVLTGASDYQLYFGMYQDKYATAVGASGAWYGLAANTPSTTVRGQWVLATMQYSASTKTTTTFLNGIAMTNKGPDAAAQNGGVAWNDLYIGQSNSAGADYRLHGYIGEILIYNSVLSTNDRRAIETYLSLKYGFGVECSGTLGSYTMPTSFTVPSTSYLTVTTITTIGASTSAAPVTVYYAATAGIISIDGLTQAGTGTLTSNSASVSTTIPVGTWYIYIRVTSPSGVVGPFLGAPNATTVIVYSLPTSITQSSIETTELLVGATSTAQTLTLAGPNTLNILAENIIVFLNTTSQEVSNCTVTGYQSSTGIVTFTASPTVLGMNYLYVKITAPMTSSTQTTTLSFIGSTNQGFYIDNSNAWSPSQLTTALWLDISDSTTITTVSGGVSEWRDKSGNSRHAGQSSVTSRPTITNNALNNLPLIVFDGVNDFMDIPTTILQTQSKPSIFYVFVRNNAGSTDGYSPEITVNSSNGSDNGSFHYVKTNLTGASYPMYNTGGWGIYDGAGSYTNGSAEIISFATLTSTSTYSVYKNGTLEGSAAAGNALSTFTGFRLAQQQGNRTSGISFGEIVLVLNATTANRESIEGYLAWKWGIQSKLPSNHPYKSGVGIGYSYAMPISFTFTPITGYVDGASSNMTITTLGGSTDSAPITVYYSSIANATSVSSLTQAGTGTLSSRTSTVSVAIPGGNWYVYIRITSPNAAVGPLILSSFTIASSTATFYYPFVSDIKNYTTGIGVSDAVMGVAGNLSGGTAIFSEKSLVLTGSPTRNAAGASYVVLPSTSSGNTAAFSCWFKSNNNGNFTRIIDMASNGSFRLYITGTNTLNFNDIYTISTTTNINNNTWNFIAINTTATTISWVINSGDAGNSGSGSISSKPVNFTGSVGYLGHSFGGDPEFAGSLKEVRFFANANLTSQQISTMYAGTTLLTSRQYTQATSIVSFTPAIPVQSAITTFAVTLGGYETVVNGTSSLYYSSINSDTNPTLIGTAALVSGVVTVSGSVPLNTFYLYARSISPTSVQGSLLVSSLVTPRVYSFPTSITFTTIQVNVNTQLTFAPADGLASASVIIYYHATNTSTNPTQCGTGTINSSGIANITCSFPSGSAVYVYARVTSPAGSQGSLLISSITGIAAPVVTITSSSGEIATRTFNGATYTCIRSSGTLTVHKAISGAEIFIIAGGGGGSFSAGGGGGAGGAAYISNASIPAGTYAVTVGAGGAAAASDGGVGSNGSNSVGFGITVYGGGGGSHYSTGYSGGCGGGAGYNSGSSGGSATASTGTLVNITGILQTYGNAGGNTPTYSNYVTAGGGGIGGVGGSTTTTPTGGAGGVGKSTWSDWCAACGVGEGDTSGVFWIGGGGGGSSNETSGVRRAGDSGKGGGGKGGFAASMTVLGFDGCATSGIDYSGGGGGGGHITLPTSLAQGYVPPGGRGGSGVIMIKQATTGVYTTINAPTDIAGLQVWLDGSDPNNGTLPVNGSTIGTWVDKVSGNLRSATPVNSANKAVYRSAGTIGGIKNTLGTMYFNNTPYKIPYTGISPTYTIFSVFRVERGLLTSGLSMTPVTTNSSCYILSGGQESCLYFGMLYDQFSTAVGVPPSTWYGMTVNTPATFIRSQWVIATMQYSAATKTTTTFLNGITMTPKGPDATAQNNGDAWNDFFIGQSPTSADYRLQGYIGEILIYNSVLSTVDRKKVESYLSLKYGLGIAITRVYTFPTSITFTSLQTSASSTTLSFSPADGFDSASVIIYYHATNSSTSPTQCGTGTINSSGSATITCTLPENQVVYIYAKVTSPTTGVESPLICSALSGTVTVLPSAVLSLDADTYTSGTILYDTSGNGYNANFSSPAPTYSKVNGIAMFTFTSSEDALVGNISDSIFKSAHSISCWFRRTSISNWAGLFSNNVNPVHSCSNLTFSAGTNSMGFEAVSAAGGTIAQVDLGTDYLNTWVYATVTLSGATIGSSVKTYVYKNGSLLTVGTGTLTWNLLSSTSYFIGKLLTGPHQFIGDIAVVQIYNRVLSASEISQNYNNLKTRFGF
jgi:hypothetical protein